MGKTVINKNYTDVLSVGLPNLRLPLPAKFVDI